MEGTGVITVKVVDEVVQKVYLIQHACAHLAAEQNQTQLCVYCIPCNWV